ncbi:MAG: M81 family metallopeptidase [Mycobacteriales bacterium]
MRIAIAGMGIESSVFSAHHAGSEDFRVVRGPAVLDRFADALAGSDDVEWVPILTADAMPGGAVEADFFERVQADIVGGLRAAGDLDGVYFPLHGAMTVLGREDAEGELAESVRRVVGPDCLISASMDPHGNVSERLARTVDLLTSHRMSPHEDRELTERRAVANLLRCLRDGVRPRRAWMTVPVLLPGERACTRDEPAKGLYERLPWIESQDGVIDAAIWIGYAWGDESRCRAAVLVSGTDEELILRHARQLAQAWWDARTDFSFSVEAGEADWAIGRGLDSPARPYFVSDSGDNPTAGGSNDVAYTLGRLLAEPRLASGGKTAIWASVVAPGAVAACEAAGVGGTVDAVVGGHFGSTQGGTIRLAGTVSALHTPDNGRGAAQRLAVVRSGGVSAVLSRRRAAFHYMRQLTDLGLDPAAYDVTVVKIGYLVPDLFDAAAGWTLALTPGGVDQELTRLGHRRLRRPIWPLDPDMPTPDFTPQVI